MATLIFSAIALGIILSFMLIGPVFFILIETSLIKGYKAGVILNLGVISADIVCIILANYCSQEISYYIQMHPILFKIGATMIALYGSYMIYSRGDIILNNNISSSERTWQLFIKGFFINFMNVGIIIFWISVVIIISVNYHNPYKFFLYISIVLSTFFILDLFKIFMASIFHKTFNNHLICKIKQISGILLIVFGISLFIKSFFLTPSLKEEFLYHILNIFPTYKG